MSIRSRLTVENAVLATLWAGMASFVVLHSVALVQGAGTETVPMFRKLWFVGLGSVALLVAVVWAFNRGYARYIPIDQW